MSDIPDVIRLTASTITNEELAYLVALFDHSSDHVATYPPPRGWSEDTENRICFAFREAAKARGIKDGVVVVTQTVDLRS